MDKEAISMANLLHDEGKISELYAFIKPFLEKNDPYAMYFSSCFSLEEWDESAEEFDKRCVELLTKASEANVPEAMYQLSSFYFVGDTVELDTAIGRDYLNKAMELNYGPAKFTVGINLYYGSNGYPKNIEKAIELVSEAVRDNVEGASEALDKIKASLI